LDAEGRHALVCEIGGARIHRHDKIRDWVAYTHRKCTGAMTVTEQHVPQWDRINPRTREIERAVMDVCTRDPRDGRTMYIDVKVTCELSENADRMRARAHKNGSAAAEGVNEKRRRYPASAVPGASLVPFVLETGGRPSEEAAALVRYWGSVSHDPDLSTARLWQQLSTILQLSNAECILSALGRRQPVL
jgi:hypothetical protein